MQKYEGREGVRCKVRYKPFYSGAASPCPVVECSMGTNGYRAELGRTLLLLTIRSYQPAFSHQPLHCPHHHNPCFLQQTQSSVRLVSRLMVTMGGQCGHSYLSSIFLFLFPVLASLLGPRPLGWVIIWFERS